MKVGSHMIVKVDKRKVTLHNAPSGDATAIKKERAATFICNCTKPDSHNDIVR